MSYIVAKPCLLYSLIFILVWLKCTMNTLHSQFHSPPPPHFFFNCVSCFKATVCFVFKFVSRWNYNINYYNFFLCLQFCFSADVAKWTSSEPPMFACNVRRDRRHHTFWSQWLKWWPSLFADEWNHFYFFILMVLLHTHTHTNAATATTAACVCVERNWSCDNLNSRKMVSDDGSKVLRCHCFRYHFPSAVSNYSCTTSQQPIAMAENWEEKKNYDLIGRQEKEKEKKNC